jgi:hypothetical protein
MNEIPGSTALGYGFNALGPYDPSSLMSQAFTQTFAKNNTYTYPDTQIAYKVPDNANVIPYSPETGRTQVFQSQYEMQEYLSVAADIEASYGAFSGQVQASYSAALEEWGSIFYGLTDAWVGTWMVVLADVSQTALDPKFAQVLNNLPAACDRSTLDTFFAFFQQYGTHFVHSVGVGGYFFYYQGIENSGSKSLQQVQVDATLEYNAVYVDASVKSQTDWSKLGEQWVSNRIVSISALGGTAKTLDDVTPVFGTNEAASFTNWVNSIAGNPSPVQYILHGWDELLSTGSPQQTALKQALETYMNYSIYVNAVYNGYAGRSQVTVAGNDVVPAESWPANPTSTAQGIEIVLIDNIPELPVTYSAVYYHDADRTDPQGFFDRIIQDLENYADPDEQWCSISIFNFPWGIPPDARLLAWLQKFGISGEKWRQNYYNCADGQASFNYIAVGLVGRRTGQELASLNVRGMESTLEVNVSPLPLARARDR